MGRNKTQRVAQERRNTPTNRHPLPLDRPNERSNMMHLRTLAMVAIVVAVAMLASPAHGDRLLQASAYASSKCSSTGGSCYSKSKAKISTYGDAYGKAKAETDDTKAKAKAESSGDGEASSKAKAEYDHGYESSKSKAYTYGDAYAKGKAETDNTESKAKAESSGDGEASSKAKAEY